MAFEKTISPGPDKHAESEAPKKTKKKRSSAEKKGVVTKAPIKAPVRFEIDIEEDKKPKKEVSKKKKNPEISDKSPDEAKEATPAKTSVKRKRKLARSRENIVEEITAEQPEQVVEAVDKTERAESHTSEFTEPIAEKIILPHETNEEEGNLFLSERLQRIFGKEPQPSPENLEEAPADDESQEEDSTTKASAATNSTSSTHASTTSTTTTARARAAVPPASVSSSSSANSATPPHIPSAGTPSVGGGGLPPVPPRHTANQSSFGGVPASANTAPSTPAAVAPERRYNNRTVERRSLIAGMLLGGVIEHVRHKRREKRMNASHEKEIKKLNDEQRFQQAEQYKNDQKTEREKTSLEKQLNRLQERLSSPQKKQEATRVPAQEQPLAVPQPPASLEANKAPSRKSETSAQSNFYEEFKRKYHSPETSTTRPSAGQPEENKAKKLEKLAPVPKQQPENIDEPLEVSPDRRVETSSWHRIEIDKKTGKAVENPELAYGEEFQREQHQEQLRQQIAEASIETEQVKQNYMPIIDKTDSTSVRVHDTPQRTNVPQKPQAASSFTDTLQGLRDKASDSNGIDIVLWFVFFLIVIAIIAALT